MATSDSRRPPITAPSDTGSVPSPAPLTSRHLISHTQMSHSQMSSRRNPFSPGMPHVGSTTNSRSSGSEFSDVVDSDDVRTRERKRRRVGIDGTEDHNTASGSSYMDLPPRPEWRNSGEYEDEDVDQLDNSESEQTRDPVHSTTSTQRQSPTPPPPTAISPILESIELDPSLSSPRPGPSHATTTSRPTSSNQSSKPSQLLRETPASPVSSPSLMKIINETNIEPGTVPSKRKRSSLSLESDIIEISPLLSSKDKGKGKARLPSSPSPVLITEEFKRPEAEPLSEYTCPICFFPPSNATLTPCGHVCCGACLFTAVKTTLQRGASMVSVGENVARCPVCRAVIPGWDGKGRGVIGIKVRQVISL